MAELSGYAYNCSAQETFDIIALVLFGDENYAADLIDANPEYAGIIEFSGGEQLYIPALDIPEDEEDEEEAELANTSAPWKDDAT